MVDELKAIREMAERNGATLDRLVSPFLASITVDCDRCAAIMRGQSPERDRDIEQLQILIWNCAAAGVFLRNRNDAVAEIGDPLPIRLGVYTAGASHGTDGARVFQAPGTVAAVASSRYAAGPQTADDTQVVLDGWNAVRMALHPNDPYVPYGYQGVDGVLGTVDGLKKFITINESLITD